MENSTAMKVRKVNDLNYLISQEMGNNGVNNYNGDCSDVGRLKLGDVLLSG